MSNPDEMTYKDDYNNQNDDKNFYFIGKHPNLNLGFDLEEKLDISEEDNKTDENLIPFIYNPSLIEVITKSTDINLEELTKRKRNRPINEVINNNPIFNNINNNENKEKEKKVNIEINIEIKPEVKNKATKRGRHKKGKSSGQDAKHNKFKADNIIRKIKTKIFQYIFKLLNNSLKHTNRRFLPLKFIKENAYASIAPVTICINVAAIATNRLLPIYFRSGESVTTSITFSRWIISGKIISGFIASWLVLTLPSIIQISGNTINRQDAESTICLVVEIIIFFMLFRPCQISDNS